VELTEVDQARLIALAVVATGVAAWIASNAVGRRLQARFAALAKGFGSEVTREAKFLSLFPVEVGGRTFDVRLQCIGTSTGSNHSSGWRVVTGIPMSGVSELHSVLIRRRVGRRRAIDPSDFERHFKVHDLGYPLRPGWLNERVRRAIAHFYALELPLDSLSIEEGKLVHRASLSLRKLNVAALRELLLRQEALAAQLERALS
jgi:hypothetical protein